ncbi:MAG: DUF2946 family protein [Steroidobacteraceae bacterium]
MHVLSLALLFAQLGMVAHASTHLKSDPHSVQTQQQVCGQCLSFAPIQNMVGDALTPVLAVRVSPDHALECVAISHAPQRPFSAFRSRAPPVSL